MYDNDHTDAEYDRREHAYELGALAPDEIAFERWSDTVVTHLINLGFTTTKQGLDADQETAGFSIDFAYDFFRDGASPEDYIEDVERARRDLAAGA